MTPREENDVPAIIGIAVIAVLAAIEAKLAARVAAENSFEDIEVHQVEVATDKETILRLLNVEGGTQQLVSVVWRAKAKLKRGNCYELRRTHQRDRQDCSFG